MALGWRQGSLQAQPGTCMPRPRFQFVAASPSYRAIAEPGHSPGKLPATSKAAPTAGGAGRGRGGDVWARRAPRGRGGRKDPLG